MGEENIFNKLIFMENVWELANRSNVFANFLTVAKNLLLLAFMFFIVYHSASNLKMITSQTKYIMFFGALCKKPL